MRYLIDTCIFLFLSLDMERLSREVKTILNDPNNIFYISSESVRELVVLFRKGKFKSKQWKNETQMIVSIEDEYNIQILPVKKEHLLTYSALAPHAQHNDPTDQVIIAQAITNRIPLISSDLKFHHYTSQKLNLIHNKI